MNRNTNSIYVLTFFQSSWSFIRRYAIIITFVLVSILPMMSVSEAFEHVNSRTLQGSSENTSDTPVGRNNVAPIRTNRTSVKTFDDEKKGLEWDISGAQIAIIKQRAMLEMLYQRLMDDGLATSQNENKKATIPTESSALALTRIAKNVSTATILENEQNGSVNTVYAELILANKTLQDLLGNQALPSKKSFEDLHAKIQSFEGLVGLKESKIKELLGELPGQEHDSKPNARDIVKTRMPLEIHDEVPGSDESMVLHLTEMDLHKRSMAELLQETSREHKGTLKELEDCQIELAQAQMRIDALTANQDEHYKPLMEIKRLENMKIVLGSMKDEDPAQKHLYEEEIQTLATKIKDLTARLKLVCIVSVRSRKHRRRSLTTMAQSSDEYGFNLEDVLASEDDLPTICLESRRHHEPGLGRRRTSVSLARQLQRSPSLSESRMR